MRTGNSDPRSEERQRKPVEPGFRLLVAVVVAGFFALAISTALTKAPWCDEGWFASPAWNLAYKGFMGTTVLDPGSGTPVLNTRTRLDGIDRHTYWVMPLYLLAEAGWIKLAGFGLMRLRMLSAILALLALVSWWVVFSEISENRYTALLGTALLAADNTFIWSAVDIRMDMMCLALGASGLAAYLLLRRRSLPWALFTANALLAASGLTHPNGFLHVLALACMLPIYDRGRLRWSYLLVSGIPYVVALAAWAPYILQAPDLFRIQLMGNAASRNTAFQAPVETLRREIQRYLYGFGFAPWSKGFAHLSIVELLTFLAGIGYCAAYRPLRRQKPATRVLTVIGTLCLFLWLFEGAKYVQYLIHILPWFSLALAIAATDCWTHRRCPQLVPAMVLGVVFVLDVARVGVPAWRDKYHRIFLPAAQYLRQNSSPSDLIMGPAELAFPLGFDRNLIDDIMMGTTTGKSAIFIVIDPRYLDYMQSIRVTAPGEYARVARQLGERYHKIYDDQSYQIYRRTDGGKHL
jgi:hypothetical protein